MKVEFKNEVISASAGSGKTYQLASRYIRLMYRGVPPEKIIAMTFTNKAAGEIFDKIVVRLLECITSNEHFKVLADTKGFEGISIGELKGILRKLIMSSHLIRIGTLDSFFFSVLSAFPYELGISGRISIQSEREAREMKMNVLKGILFNPGEEQGRIFMEEFKKATFGEEVKTIQTVMDNFIDSTFYTVLDAPEYGLWGDVERIVGRKFYGSLSMLTNKELEENCTRISRMIADTGEQALIKQMESFISSARACTLVNPQPAQLNAFAGNLVDLLGGSGPLQIRIGNRKAPYTIPEEARTHLRTLWNHILRCHLDNAAHTTKGIYNILKQYEARYSDLIRYTGRLSFSDVLFALSTGYACLTSGGAEGKRRHEDMMLNIGFRLDGHFDHWLLDEFQDTSSAQWNVISNLIMEIVQDDSGRRSFFYVGDVKQSIYQWRGGEPGLFDYVRESYGDIETTPLNASYRSSGQIIAVVNGVFDKVSSGEALGLPKEIPREVSERLHWNKHSFKKKHQGFAALIDVPASESDEEPMEIDRKADVIISEIRRIRPFERGLSVGILVRDNKMGSSLADALKLRQKEVDVTLEGIRNPCDNMIVSAMLAIVKLSAHPGDKFCREYLGMTPLAGIIGGNTAEFAVTQLETIQRIGFSEFIDGWKMLMLSKNILRKDDIFHIRRMDQLAAIGEEFDASGNKSCDDFISAVENFEIPSASLANSIQIMTIHKAKGLEFDIVFLPQLKSSRGGIFSSSRRGVRMKKNERHEAEWCLEMPPRDIAGKIPAFDEFYSQEESNAAYENLCLLYVAMTRARRALYMFADQPGRSSVHLCDIVRRTLASDEERIDRSWLDEKVAGVRILYADGIKDWFESEPRRKSTEIGHHSNFKFSFDKNISHRTPSGSETWKHSASELFRFNTALELGSAVHELFSRIEWTDSGSPAVIESEWTRSLPPYSADTIRRATEIFRKALKSGETAKVFSRPEGKNVELWRERRFEMMLENRHVSGAFDRVVIVRDKAGAKIISAEIIDFKTGMPGNIEKAVESYAPQLEMYQQILSRMLGIPASSIGKTILFVELGECRRL